MFTGIIEELGEIKNIRHGIKSATLTIEAKKVLKDSHIGDSIAVNGVCLTATTILNGYFTADVMAESMRRTSLGDLNVGSKVNLERAMAANGRFGGHIVSGHIDGTGIIKDFTREDNAVWITIGTSQRILKYIIEKGSITIDGVSLTVAYLDDSCFKVSIIPHTAGNTTLLDKKIGSKVNLENDIIGKYVEKLLRFNDTTQNDIAKSDTAYKKCDSNIDTAFLIKNGFL